MVRGWREEREQGKWHNYILTSKKLNILKSTFISFVYVLREVGHERMYDVGPEWGGQSRTCGSCFSPSTEASED